MESVLAAYLKRKGQAIADSLLISLPIAAAAGADDLAKADNAKRKEDLERIIEVNMDWASLIPEIAPITQDEAVDAAKEYLLSIHIPEVIDAAPNPLWTQVLAQAREMAAKRAAELVGKRVLPNGKIIDNPDAKWSITETTRGALKDLVTESIDKGWTTSQLQHKIMESEQFGAQRALMIGRTETAYARSRGTHEAAKGAGMKFKSWLPDDTACEEICIPNSEQGRIPIDDDFESGDDVPPAHPNCLLGDTLVSPGVTITGVSARKYDGDIIIIRTESGKLLRITPNHPVLTDSGWVNAGILRKGDSVLCSLDSKRSTAPDYDNQNIPAMIQEIVESLLSSGKMATREVPVSSEDFHGDSSDGEIAIIGTHRRLPIKHNGHGGQHPSKFLFVLADDIQESLPSSRSLDQFFDAALDATNRIVAWGHKAAAFFWGHSRLAHEHGRTAASDGNVVLNQRAPHDGAADGKALADGLLAGSRKILAHNGINVRQRDTRSATRASANVVVEQDRTNGCDTAPVSQSNLFDRTAGHVFLDNIASIQRGNFRGQVYNLETKDGWYIGNSIIVHNCRCSSGYYEGKDGD